MTVTDPDWKQHVHVKRIGQPCQWAEEVPCGCRSGEPAGASSFKSCFVVCVWSNEVLLVLALADSEARCWH